MLAELAITPQVFEESDNAANPRWREDLREMSNLIFPPSRPREPNPLVIADLHAGSWKNMAASAIKNIGDQRTRLLAEGLWGKLRRILVKRPACSDWPGDNERGWIHEAMESNRDHPLSRIVITSDAQIGVDRSPPLHSLARLCDSDLWHDVRCVRSIPARLTDQMNELRSICRHAGFLAVVCPYILGGGDDETAFVVQLMRLAGHRPNGWHKAMFDIHTQSGKDDQATSNIIENIRSRLVTGRSDLSRVRLILWEKLLDRFLIAGERMAGTDGKFEAGRCRWVVSLSHVARNSGGNADDFHTFSLLSQQDGEARYQRFYGGSAKPVATIEL